LSVLDVQSFTAADCDTDHYLVVVKVIERLAVNKQNPPRFLMEKLSEVGAKEKSVSLPTPSLYPVF
jgi:hypothetical protein